MTRLDTKRIWKLLWTKLLNDLDGYFWCEDQINNSKNIQSTCYYSHDLPVYTLIFYFSDVTILLILFFYCHSSILHDFEIYFYYFYFAVTALKKKKKN